MVTFTGHADIVRCCCYSPDGSRIVSCSDDTLVKVCGDVLRYHPGKNSYLFQNRNFQMIRQARWGLFKQKNSKKMLFLRRHQAIEWDTKTKAVQVI